MSIAQNPSEKFATVFDKSPYQSSEPIVKIQHIPKGNNVVFGRTLKDNNHRNLVYIGKVLENTSGKNYLSADAWLDVTFPHVIYITGTRGSGKSFDLGVLLEGISELSQQSPIQNEVDPIASILIDTQSQFWTLKYQPNPKVPENKQQLDDLKKWNIKENSLARCQILIPHGTKPITGDETVFHLRPSQVLHEEWCNLIGEDVYGPQGHVLAQTVDAFAQQNFSIQDMLNYIRTPGNWQNVADSSRNAVFYKLESYQRTGLFSKEGLDVKTLLKPGQCTVLMLRDLRNEDKSLVTGLIARQLFTTMGEYHKKLKVDTFFGRSGKSESLPKKVWLFIDEAHVVAPSGNASPAKDALVEYVKRGRDAGLSLIMATQQPSAVDDRILSQVNISFSHRLTFQNDITSAINRVPTKLLSRLRYSGVELSDFGDMLRHLESGECFVGDGNTSRAVMTCIRPRITSHGGYNPV
jgi:uncharacterized protein